MISVFINWLIFSICVICLVPTTNTEPVAHLVVITTDVSEFNVYKEFYKINKNTRLLMGTGDGKSARNFYLLPGNLKTSSELREVLKNINGVREIFIVSLSNPITNSELADVRKLYFQNKMDASGVSDDELSLYLNSHLKGESTYILHSEKHDHSIGVSYLKLKLESEILKNYNEEPNTKTTITSKTTRWEGDIEISDITISVEVSVEPPEPPPPPPANFSKMSDAQIIKWYLKYDPNLKKEDIEIKRTPTEIIITEKRNGSTGTTRYRIN